MIGDKQNYLPVKITTNDRQMDVETFTLADDVTQLGEVSITEKRPLFKSTRTEWSSMLPTALLPAAAQQLKYLKGAASYRSS